jgi:predicted ATP-grasp superfamily ATP-dependent carboligase
VPFADYSTWIKARDKAQTMKLALELNIPHPKTYYISKIEELVELTGRIEYPVVVKPRLSCGSWGVTCVEKREELHNKYLTVHNKYPYPIIQEFIPRGGDAYGVSLLFNRDSQVRAIFAHRRLREFPVSGGPSTLRESVHRPDLVEVACKLLKALDWYGLAMVEFKEDPRDGQCKVLEINPRFWGSLALAVVAGVDFPYLLYKMTMEGDVEAVTEYPQGVRCRWLLPGDILHFLKNPKRFKLKPSFFDFSGNNRNDDFISWRDIGPTIGFFLNAFMSLFQIHKWKLLLSRSQR